MVTILKTSSSIARTLAYNEDKVKIGTAQCIGAGNFPVDLDRISDSMKLNRFTKITSLNLRTKRNTLHITLNFAPSESYSKEKLMAITTFFMERIGFGKQPFLVYEHYDAGHAHLHIVSIKIQRDGTPISLYKLVYNKSEPARKEIEELFGLVKAQGPKIKDDHYLTHAPNRIHYGRMESKKAITQVLNYTLNHYSYTSFSELNALLRQYNVIATRFNENSKTFLSGGLLYQILNEHGKPIGVPIKASLIENKPNLLFLEEKFKSNSIKSEIGKSRMKKSIAIAALRSTSREDLIRRLQRQGIRTIIPNTSEGQPQEIFFIEHQTKNILTSTDLNVPYIMKTIMETTELKPTVNERKNKQFIMSQ